MTLYDDAEMESSLAQAEAEDSKRMSHAEKVAKAEALKNKYVSEMHDLGYSQEDAAALAARKSDKEAQDEKGHPIRTALAVGGFAAAAIPVAGATAAQVTVQHKVNDASNRLGAAIAGRNFGQLEGIVAAVERETKLNSGHGGRER